MQMINQYRQSIGISEAFDHRIFIAKEDTRSSFSLDGKALLRHNDSITVNNPIIDNGKITYRVDMEIMQRQWGYLHESLKIISYAFENQRKMYKYAKAWNSYQNDYISEDEMDQIEEKVTIKIDKSIPISTVNAMVKVLFENINEDEFSTEELSTILGVSEEYIAEITAKINQKIEV